MRALWLAFLGVALLLPSLALPPAAQAEASATPPTLGGAFLLVADARDKLLTRQNAAAATLLSQALVVVRRLRAQAPAGQVASLLDLERRTQGLMMRVVRNEAGADAGSQDLMNGYMAAMGSPPSAAAAPALPPPPAAPTARPAQAPAARPAPARPALPRTLPGGAQAPPMGAPPTLSPPQAAPPRMATRPASARPAARRPAARRPAPRRVARPLARRPAPSRWAQAQAAKAAAARRVAQARQRSSYRAWRARVAARTRRPLARAPRRAWGAWSVKPSKPKGPLTPAVRRTAEGAALVISAAKALARPDYGGGLKNLVDARKAFAKALAAKPTPYQARAIRRLDGGAWEVLKGVKYAHPKAPAAALALARDAVNTVRTLAASGGSQGAPAEAAPPPPYETQEAVEPGFSDGPTRPMARPNRPRPASRPKPKPTPRRTSPTPPPLVLPAPGPTPMMGDPTLDDGQPGRVR